MDLKDGSKLHIAFGYIHGNGFDPSWVRSLTGLLLHEISKPKEARILASIIPKGGCYVGDNRDAVAIDLCNVSKDDWVLMIDPDIEFGPNILELFADHIVKNPKARIIAGRVNLANGFPVFYKVTRQGQIQQPFYFEGLKEFDLVGTGIICIHREAFKKIGEMEKHFHFFDQIITRDRFRLGDDFSFCLRAKRAKIPIYGAWNIYGQHWKPQPCFSRYPDLPDLLPDYAKKNT